MSSPFKPLSRPFDGPPKNETCAKCKKRKATSWWTGENGLMGAVHGMAEAYCDICVVNSQLKYVREQAARIPALEALLKAHQKRLRRKS